MSWNDELDDLRRREAMAEKMGGPEKVARQHARGKQDARARLSALLDPRSFREIGKTAGVGRYDERGDLQELSPSNFIFGRGHIDGRAIVATADDFTVRGGAADAAVHRKFVQAEQMAHELMMPLVRMIDGTGGGGSVKMLEDMGYTYVPYVPGWEHVVENLDRVPVVALALGPTAGLGAARVVASHYSVMVRDVSQLFTAGPAVAAFVGDQLTKEELGGADIHTRNGVVDDEAGSEDEAMLRCRSFLSYLPSNVHELADRSVGLDKPERREEELLHTVPKDPHRTYSMRNVLEQVLDLESVFEIGRHWGQSVITALARLDGWPVAVIASNPSYLGGSWTADASAKVERFVQLAEQFHLPIVHFVDNPGFMIGLDAEKSGVIRQGVRAMNAIYKAKTPWATVILRKAYGIAGSAMSNATTFQYRFAWPSGDWGSLPLDGGIEVAYKSELEASDDPKRTLEQIRERLDKVRSPLRSAERFAIEDIIDPRDTRPLLCEFANHAQRRLRAKLQTN